MIGAESISSTCRVAVSISPRANFSQTGPGLAAFSEVTDSLLALLILMRPLDGAMKSHASSGRYQ
jgi:hypothetical protein